MIEGNVGEELREKKCKMREFRNLATKIFSRQEFFRRHEKT